VVYRINQKISHRRIISESYQIVLSRPNILKDIFVELKCQSITVTLTLGDNYSMRGLISDVNYCVWSASCDMRQIR